MKKDYKKITTIGMLCAAAYIAVVLCRIPVVLFLSYEPKDVIITIAGFIFGPLTSFVISVIVSFIEMITISSTGPWGFFMNMLSSCAFSCTAAYIYKKKRTLFGAAAGLLSGTAVMCALMIIWNYLITPIYMNVPREQIVSLLVPAFLPFNLLKGFLNTALTLIVYKPLVKALRGAGLIPERAEASRRSSYLGITLISLLIIATCVFFILILQGKI